MARFPLPAITLVHVDENKLAWIVMQLHRLGIISSITIATRNRSEEETARAICLQLVESGVRQCRATSIEDAIDEFSRYSYAVLIPMGKASHIAHIAYNLAKRDTVLFIASIVNNKVIVSDIRSLRPVAKLAIRE